MRKIISIFIMLLTLTSCSIKWDYLPLKNQYKRGEQSFTINVKTFVDDRPKDAENKIMKPGKLILHWVPLILWSNITTVNRPEENGIDMLSMTEVLPQNTALEIQNTGMFKDVVINGNSTYDYTLKGTIIETLTKRSATSYGLSLAGSVLEGVFCFPAGNVKNFMKIKFELVDKKGNTVFTKVYEESSWKPFFIYKLFSKSGLSIQSSLFQHINHLLIRDLEDAIRKNTDS